MILTRQLIVTEAKGRNAISQVGRDITPRFFPLDNIVNDCRRSSITQTRLFMVFHPDDILRSKGHDLFMGSLHSIDTKLNRFSIIGSNTFSHRIDGQSRQLKMLKKGHPIRRCFLLSLRRHHQLSVYLLNHLLAFHHHFVQQGRGRLQTDFSQINVLIKRSKLHRKGFIPHIRTLKNVTTRLHFFHQEASIGIGRYSHHLFAHSIGQNYGCSYQWRSIIIIQHYPTDSITCHCHALHQQHIDKHYQLSHITIFFVFR